MHGKRLRFFSMEELVTALELENAQNNAGHLVHRLMYVIGPEKPLQPAWMLVFRGDHGYAELPV